MDQFNNEEIAIAIGNLTVMEIIALTKEMEAKWNLFERSIIYTYEYYEYRSVSV